MIQNKLQHYLYILHINKLCLMHILNFNYQHQLMVKHLCHIKLYNVELGDKLLIEIESIKT